MAITGEPLTQGSYTATSVSSQATGTITAGSGYGESKPGRLIIIDIFSADAQNVFSVSGIGLTWTEGWAGPTDPEVTAGGPRISRWYAVGTPTTGAITIDWLSPVDSSMWIVTQFADTEIGLNGQFAFVNNTTIGEQGNGANYTLNLPGALSSPNNAMLVLLARNVADAPTVDLDFTPLAVTTVTAPDGSLSVCYAIGETACSITGTSADYAYWITELKSLPIATSAGTSSASAVGITAVIGDGTSAGTATASAQSLSTGTSTGTATASAEGAAVCTAAGTSAGIATADAVAIPPSVGTSAGTATADAVSGSATISTGTSDGTSTATGVAISSTTSVGTAAGIATVTGIALGPSVGASFGVATAQAVSLVTARAVGSSAGFATVFGVSLTTVVNVESVDVIARDMIEVVFSQSLVVNDALRDPTTYTIDHTAGDGQAVAVNEVVVPAGRSATSVRLIVTPFTIGASYYVVVEKDVLRATAGDYLTSDNAHEFIGRETKVDRIVANRQTFYDLSPGTVIRSLFDAIGQSDDLIGGARSDRIRGPVDSSDL